MEFAFTEKEEAFRQEVRDFLATELPPGLEIDEVSFGTRYDEVQAFIRKMGEKGWLTLAWPKEYGGRGASPMEQIIFMEEMAYHRAGGMCIGTTWVGPSIMNYGTEEQKKKYLPEISSGEIEVCLGYSEPQAGSDLASLQTRAVADGDQYVINGQKIFTSMAHVAKYCWLAARTNPEAPKKHKGISMFMVDMNTPGITVRPLYDLRGSRVFNEVFFDDVRVNKDCLVGGENNGWYVLMTALSLERGTWGGGANNVATCQRLLDELVNYVKATEVNGKPLADDPSVQDKLAQMAIDIEVARLLAYRLAWIQSRGIIPVSESSVSKIFGSEMQRNMGNIAMDIAGLHGQLKANSKWTPLNGHIENMYLWAIAPSIGAGTDEIQRGLIATMGLGLPRQ